MCSTFLLATRQLFPSSAYFGSAADLMVREYALMLKVSKRGRANFEADHIIDHIFFSQIIRILFQDSSAFLFAKRKTRWIRSEGTFLLQIVVLVHQALFFSRFCQPATHLSLFYLLHTFDLCLSRLFWENFLIGVSSQARSLYIISHHPHLHRD